MDSSLNIGWGTYYDITISICPFKKEKKKQFQFVVLPIDFNHLGEFHPVNYLLVQLIDNMT
jgi:hypothetical protein